LLNFDGTGFFCADFRKKKPSNLKFKENLSSKSRVVPFGQTDRHDENNSRLPQFCESAKKPEVKPFKIYKFQLLWEQP